MKAKDLKIISLLRSNARMSLTKISRKTNIPVTTIFDRLKYNEGVVIKKHTCLLNYQKLGYSTIAIILLAVDRDNRKALQNFLVSHRLINTVYKISNGYDFMLEGIFKQINEMEEFIEDIDSKFRITSKKYFFILEDVKRESFLSVDNSPHLGI